MKQLFQCAILKHVRGSDGTIEDTVFIKKPEFRLAKSEKDLLFKLTREIPDESVDDPDNIQILIRNF